ncbi:MAG: putative two-component system response regulator [Candidatus Azotimanducaceae bacterium]|jgi:putative two-component system response regulator
MIEQLSNPAVGQRFCAVHSGTETAFVKLSQTNGVNPMNNTETRQKICIVDDDAVQATLICMMLSQDYEVIQAASGGEALELIRRENPDLVLLDVMMPDIDGLDVCEQLKSNPETSGIPVVFLTGLEDASDQERGFELGADDYITKPVSPNVVKARVGRILNLSLYIEFLESLLSEKDKNLESLRDKAKLMLSLRT